MNDIGLWIGGGAAAIVVLVAIVALVRKPTTTPGALSGDDLAEHLARSIENLSSPSEETIRQLRQNLRVKCGHNQALMDRLIDHERQRLPSGNEETWLRAAIEQWERDNR